MAANTKPKPARLGRGLSSLMGHPPFPPLSPVATLPPSPLSPVTEPLSPAPAGTESTANSQPSLPTSPAIVTADLAVIEIPAHSPSHRQVAPTSDLPATGNEKEEANPGTQILFVPIHAIRPNPHQPRQTFDAATLQGLADSIKADGVMQPIILRPPSPPSSPPPLKKSDGGTLSSETSTSNKNGQEAFYELIAGERRWRAAQLAGLTHIPAIVRELDDRQSAQWALVENLQRQDLNPMERAHAFARLAEQFSLSHEQIAQQVGVDRSTITNSLRLLGLSHDVQSWISEGLLSNGHAKALAGMNDVHQQSALASQAIRAQWSVRQLELAVKNAASTTAAAPSPAMKTRQSHFQDLEEQIGQQLQTKVHLRAGRRKGAGALVIEFYTLEQFDSLLARLDVKTEI